KYSSLDRPRKLANTTAPRMPNGTTSMTAIGTDQLSYSAARQRNTTRIDSAYSSGAWAPDWRSWNDRPVHSKPNPGGSRAASLSIMFIASPELMPGAPAP